MGHSKTVFKEKQTNIWNIWYYFKMTYIYSLRNHLELRSPSLHVIIFETCGANWRSWYTYMNPPNFLTHSIFMSILNVPHPNLFNSTFSSPLNITLEGLNVGCNFTSTLCTNFASYYSSGAGLTKSVHLYLLPY